ncbi:MAG TPA: DinB family protein, partial [Chitinophagales bacterium]|nr:DinB family protein [Chitinophagales bacterium]
KMQGEAFRSPDDNYLSEPDNVSPQAWEQLLADFEQVDTDWRNFISSLSDAELDQPYTPADGKYTWYAVIHGLMHHDNYHFGQIIMLKKMLP